MAQPSASQEVANLASVWGPGPVRRSSEFFPPCAGGRPGRQIGLQHAGSLSYTLSTGSASSSL